MEVSSTNISKQKAVDATVSPKHTVKPTRQSFGMDKIVLVLVLLYLLVPLGATFIFSLSDGKNLGLSSFQRIISDADFATTFPLYLDVTGQNDAHKAAALTILSFTITLICVLGIIILIRFRPGGARKDSQIEIGTAK